MSDAVEKINRLIEGFRSTALIALAVKVGVFDKLGEDPRSAGELAAELKLNEGALNRLLRGLALLELVEEHQDAKRVVHRYRLSTAGSLLGTDARGNLAKYALLTHSNYVPAWLRMESALRGEGVPFQSAFGKPVWQFRQDHPDQGALFNAWLHGRSSTVVDEIVEALRISPGSLVADIGGGNGVLLARVLRDVSDSRGLLADQPAVLSQAKDHLGAAGLSGRCRLVPTDFFVSVPAGADVYLLKSVLHDWEDADCLRILVSLRAAMSCASRLCIIERIMPVLAIEDPEAVWLDLHMLNVTGGRERTLVEYKSILTQAGFGFEGSVPTRSGFHILEAVKTS